MNLTIVQQEIENWKPEEQDRLAAYLAVLRLKRTAGHADELSRRLDEKAPEKWLTLAEVKKRLQD